MKAFTLVELLLTMSLFLIISVTSVSLYQNFLFQSELDNGVEITVRALRSAQAYSQSSYGDSPWGVKILTGKIIVFKGATYDTRDVTEDIIYFLYDNLGFSGTSEVVFTKSYGLPNAAATISYSNVGNFRSITLNAKGTIQY